MPAVSSGRAADASGGRGMGRARLDDSHRHHAPPLTRPGVPGVQQVAPSVVERCGAMQLDIHDRGSALTKSRQITLTSARVVGTSPHDASDKVAAHGAHSDDDGDDGHEGRPPQGVGVVGRPEPTGASPPMTWLYGIPRRWEHRIRPGHHPLPRGGPPPPSRNIGTNRRLPKAPSGPGSRHHAPRYRRRNEAEQAGTNQAGALGERIVRRRDA